MNSIFSKEVLREKSVYKKIFIVLLLIFFIPSSSKIGGFQLWYGLVLSVLVMFMLKSRLYSSMITTCFSLFFISNFIVITFSLLSGSVFGSFKDLNEYLKVFGICSVFYFFYCNFSLNYIGNFVRFFKFFLIFQLLICFLQGFDNVRDLLGLLWDAEKVWDLRRTGTFTNPNILSIFCIACYSYIFFNVKWKSKVIYAVVVFGIILFTSSKTGLISFLAILNVNFLLNRKKINLGSLVLFFSSLFVFLMIFIQLLYFFKDDYPYLAQILAMFDNNMDVGEIKSIGDRQRMWDNALNEYNHFSYFQKFFGIGPAKESGLNVIDNEFLTILVKHGINGLLFYGLFLIVLLNYTFQNRLFNGGKVILSIVALFVLCSTSASTFIAWHLSLMLFLFLGICLKEIDLVKNNNR